MEPRGDTGALRTLIDREHLAVTVYKRQIGAFRKWPQIDRWLEEGAANEEWHRDGITARLREFGGRPSVLRFFFALAGGVIGLGSRVTGKRMLLKIDIGVERLAVKHYTTFLGRYSWDDETRVMLEKMRHDEEIHIQHWEQGLDMLRGMNRTAGG